MIVRAAVVDGALAHARIEAPRECCGILLGRAEAIVDLAPAANLSNDPNRYLIDPKDHIDARRRARAHDLDVVGFYHSHPRSAAVPSPTDLAEWSYPESACLIVSLAGEPQAQLFRLMDGRFVEIPIQLDDAQGA